MTINLTCGTHRSGMTRQNSAYAGSCLHVVAGAELPRAPGTPNFGRRPKKGMIMDVRQLAARWSDLHAEAADAEHRRTDSQHAIDLRAEAGAIERQLKEAGYDIRSLVTA